MTEAHLDYSTSIRNVRALSRQNSERPFLGVMALLFLGSAVTAIVWCASMSKMGGTPMPGGWTMSMVWMRMPGQSWPGAAAAFLGMWLVMMLAMMLPCLAPLLWSYRRAVGKTANGGLDSLTALAGAGYLAVWSALGIIIYPIGIALAAVEMRQPVVARTVPIIIGIIVLIAGMLQFTAWKAHRLAGCRVAPGCGGSLQADAFTAFRHGLRLGLDCCYCCANLTAILLVSGVMDLRVMAVVTVAITVERLTPTGERAARATGGVVVVAGLLLSVGALAFG
jgi:predicted metal-binding membrane protein